MSTTSISQLELCGVIAGDSERVKNPRLAMDEIATSAGQGRPREKHSGETDSRPTAVTKSKTPRNVSETSVVETLLTFAEAARALGISLRQFRRLVDNGRVTFVKVSERTPRARPSELQRFLEASAVKYTEVQS